MAYDDVQMTMNAIPELLAPAYANRGERLPTPTVPEQYNVSLGQPPIIITGSRFNLRNNYHSSDASQVPLQFVYEAANCRLFYQPLDLHVISNLWQRVANVTWSGGRCVPGSSVNGDDTLPSGAYNTVPLGPSAKTNISMSFTPPGIIITGVDGENGTSSGSAPPTPPGVIINGIINGGGANSTGNNTISALPTGFQQASSAVGLSANFALLVCIFGIALI